MSVDELRSNQDAEDPTTILWWDQYAKVEGAAVSDYLFEGGTPIAPLDDLRVPTSAYTSREWHEREVEFLWTKTWQVACRANDIPEPGDFLEYEIVGHSILIVRDESGAVGAFRNACRHRGTAVAEGSGNKKCFTCPFHGWRYGLDGSLETIPAEWDFPHVDKSTMGLVPVRAETFDGFVFINLDADAEPLEDHLGPTLPRHLAVTDNTNMWKAFHGGVVVESNWKVMVEAFQEVYHTATAHPSLLAYGSDLQARYDRYGIHQRLIAPLMVGGVIGGSQFTEQEIVDEAMEFARAFSNAGENPEPEDKIEVPADVTARQFMAGLVRAQAQGQGIDLSGVSDSEVLDAVLYTIFPNLMPFRSPAGNWVYRFRPNGDDPGSCIFDVMHLVPLAPGAEMPPDAPLTMADPGQSLADLPELGELGFLVNQDVVNCRLQQKGLHLIDEIVLGARQEANILNFHLAIAHVMEKNRQRAAS